MIELVILDVDGCLTDGKIVYTEKGDELKAFNVKDGLIIKSWMRLGKKAAIITGRRSQIVARRAEELGIEHCYQGVRNKWGKCEELCAQMGIGPVQVAAIGDDLNDYRMLQKIGKSFAPANASGYVLEMVDIILTRGGGEGAVREMLELLIREEGLEKRFLDDWT